VLVCIDPSAQELQALRWELLRHPQTGVALGTSERVLLSRFMASQDWRRIELRPRAQLRAVIAVSAPSDLAQHKLAAVDLDGEVARAQRALAGIEVTVLGEAQALTLDHLVDALRTGADIVYLVCHGILTARFEPVLYLQSEAGTAARVKGAELALRLGELPVPPRLMVLASCESAGREDASASAAERPTAQASLAPLLADAGVPAVLAMQGKISMETVRIALPRFFAELLQDGQIDRALAVARGAVRGRPDHWIPALFLRLKNGRLWSEPTAPGAPMPTTTQAAITPVAGPGTLEPAKLLHRLFLSLFSTADSFRQWVALGPDGAELVADFPGGSVAASTAIFGGLDVLRRRGYLDAEFFARLAADFPRRRDDIAHAAAAFGFAGV